MPVWLLCAVSRQRKGDVGGQVVQIKTVGFVQHQPGGFRCGLGRDLNVCGQGDGLVQGKVHDHHRHGAKQHHGTHGGSLRRVAPGWAGQRIAADRQVLRSGWVIGELQCGQRFIAIPSFFTLADAVNFAQHGCLYPEYIDREMLCQPSFLEKTHGHGRINLPRRRVV